MSRHMRYYILIEKWLLRLLRYYTTLCNFACIKTIIMGAPYGNKYSVGNHGGRPPKYETPDELQAQIDDYFQYIKGEVKQGLELDETGELKETDYVRAPEPATITGLCLHCGFETRSTLDRYADRSEEFRYIVKLAKIRVERKYETNLSGNNVAGSIFALKNMGWADNSKLDVTTDGEKIRQPIVRLPDGTELEL